MTVCLEHSLEKQHVNTCSLEELFAPFLNIVTVSVTMFSYKTLKEACFVVHKRMQSDESWFLSVCSGLK